MASKKKNSTTTNIAVPDGAMEAATADLMAGEGNNLDKVRSILFGAQARETEKRFARVEESLEREMSVMRDAMQRRMDELETFMRDEFASLNKRLTAEQRQREGSDEDLASDIKAQAKTARASLATLEEQVNDQERALRERILEQSRSHSEEMQQRFETLSAMVKDGQNQLRDDKTDSKALADLFEEVATRLRGEFDLSLDQ